LLSPGDTFYFILQLPPNLGKTIYVSLVHTQLDTVRHELEPNGPIVRVQERYGQLVFGIPASARDGLYDLEVRGDDWTHRIRHCIGVVTRFASRFRFVHLSDMNVDDPSAPAFDARLADEINLLAPAFIVATGDFTEWARMLDQPGDWTRVLAFFARFDAPAFLICGDHDHQAGFSGQVVNSPVGSFDYGNHHGILLLDHSAQRLGDDVVRWLRDDLADHRDSIFNFIVTHNDALDVLDVLAPDGNLPQFVRDHRLAMIITGGHTDWDYHEFAGKLAGLEDLHYIRTHQASTALRDRATGVSHYRVIEVDGERIDYVYPDDMARVDAQHSIPVGRLRVFHEDPNDGTRTRVRAVVQNALNQPFDNCRLWLRVAKAADATVRPRIAGGRLRAVFDGGSFWLCDVGYDLPDKGGARVMVATEGTLPKPAPLSIALGGPRELTFAPQRSPDGIAYYACRDTLLLRLTNHDGEPVRTWPVVRLNGNVVPVDDEHGQSRPVTIAPGETLEIPLRLALGRVSPGRHLMQVFFLDDPLKRATTFGVTLNVDNAATYNTPVPPAK
jgi:hypothetical protein